MSHFEEASRYIAGGVNSPVRAFRGVGGEPVFIRRARGACVETEDGRRLIDYVGSWGPMILGHADPGVIAAVTHRAIDGLSFGAPTVIETELARRIVGLMPSIELLRMVSSGTEATMSAIRLARGFTGRDRIREVRGLLSRALGRLARESGLRRVDPRRSGLGRRAGCSRGCHDDPRIQRPAGLERCFAAAGGEIACVIVEPVAGNMGCVPPAPGFLQAMRELCTRHGAVLIFDEVMTGFRVAPGGAQALYGVKPDLTTLGKIVGGGMPVGAFGGRREIMVQLAPLGPVYQAGTLSGNPVAMAAGLATLDALAKPGFHDDSPPRRQDSWTASQALHARRHCARGQPGVRHVRALLHGERAVSTYRQVMACDAARFRRFFHGMLDAGVYLAPSPYEAGFVSAAHGDAEDCGDDRSSWPRVCLHGPGPLMRAATIFLAAIFGTLLLAALFAGRRGCSRMRWSSTSRSIASSAVYGSFCCSSESYSPCEGSGSAAARIGATACRAPASCARPARDLPSASRPCCRCRSQCSRRESSRCEPGSTRRC